MAKYRIEITRISYSTETFEVEAKSKQAAINEAMDEAYDTYFDEDDAEYEVNSYVKTK